MLSKARQNIEKYRKVAASLQFYDSAGKPLKNCTVEINQQTPDFLFGNLSEEIFDSGRTPSEVRLFRNRFVGLFNFTELTIKWAPYEKDQGKPGWQKLKQKLDWYRENGITPEGHTLGGRMWPVHRDGCKKTACSNRMGKNKGRSKVWGQILVSMRPYKGGGLTYVTGLTVFK